MIWYTKHLKSHNQPDQSLVRLIGVYNQPGTATNIIEIKLEILPCSDCTITILTLFTHNPSGVQYNTPTAEDVLARYNHKISKIVDKVSNTEFDKLTTLKSLS